LIMVQAYRDVSALFQILHSQWLQPLGFATAMSV
jgi:hypothetical protein